MILMNAAADLPLAALDGRTPLEAAATPNLDQIARAGRQGTVATIPPGLTPSDDVALVSLLGRDPRKDYPGPGPVEAAGHAIRLAPGEIALRCNLVTIADGRMLDARAGHIPSVQATQLIEAMNRDLSSA